MLEELLSASSLSAALESTQVCAAATEEELDILRR